MWPGKVHFPDVLNKDARKWFGDKYQVLLDQGIEGCTWDGNRGCADQSLMADLKACVKYGIKGIDIRFDCLNKYLEEGGTLEELNAFMKENDIVPLSYNALCFFNMKSTQEEKDAVMAELDDIIAKCAAIDCHMVVVVPSCDLAERGIEATRQEIRDEAVAVLKEMIKKCEPTGLKLSLEFCGAPSMSINTFDDAYEIVKLVDSPLMGVTLDQYHFNGMRSDWSKLEKADGDKIFVWHLNDTEDVPAGAGDSFIAGFMEGVIRGLDIPGCLQNGAALAAQVVAQFNPY